jgi:hypothetical protein
MTDHTQNAENGSMSAVKRLVIFLLNVFGKPVFWFLLMIMVFVSEQINGASIFGMYWHTVLLFAYFVSRIAVALEAIAERKH